MLKFEWNQVKASQNSKKHGISFEEAKSVFFDDFALQFFDEEHSLEEDQFIMLGMSNKNRILIVCHCEQQSVDIIRIISARKATSKEKKFYSGN